MQPWFTGMPALPAPFAPQPAALFHPGVALAPGTVVGNRYRVIRDIQESRCGFIYLVAEQTQPDARRLLKTFDPRRGDAKDEDLFRREARLLQRIRHPRVPRGHGIVTHQGMLAAAQDFIEGVDLHAHVRAHGPVQETEAIEILRQVLETLAHLHGRSPAILHRDVKPENLLLDPGGAIHLVDLGSATDTQIDRAQVPMDQWTTMQTLGYAAPEQLFGLEAFPATDLYSLGATMLHVLTGFHPVQLYDGQTARLVWDAPIRPGLRALLDDLLAFPVGARVPSAAAALERLGRVT